jgi:hypothetical protein
MNVQNFAEEYQSKTDEELLRLAAQTDQLIAEADIALRNELAKRRIDGKDRLEAFRKQEQQNRIEAEKNPGKLFLIHPYGIGRKRFGKAECVYDSQTKTERFKTTIFVVLFWLPLIPTGTYLVARRREFLSNQITVLEKLSLDWEQILKVWVVAAGIVFALLWASTSLPHLLSKP